MAASEVRAMPGKSHVGAARRRKPDAGDRAGTANDDALSDTLDARTAEELRNFFDAEWYLTKYPDLRLAKIDPLSHYIRYGAAEGRDPNRYFDSAWYAARYPDVASSGYAPLMHYLAGGAAQLRHPHPHFDAVYYADMHPEAARNPLLYHIRIGAAQGWPTERPVDINGYLPSKALPASCPDGVVVDVIIAAYRGLRETRDCLTSVLDDPDRPAGEIIVVDDCSPEPKLAAWLRKLADNGRITLLHNRRNLGFVASVNRGMEAAGTHDVALLNSDTVVPHGWLRRLAAQAYAVPRVASVSPFSNNATICGYPSAAGVTPAFGLDAHTIDATCRTVNVGRRVEVPTTVGFCMYIRRAALNDVGLFDSGTFGHGYGEENDFCLRAAARGWRHMLACDTYVFHHGNISFGAAAARWKQLAFAALVARYPDYAATIDRHVRADPAGPARLAVTASLLRASGKPGVLMVSHELGGGVRRHIQELVARLDGTANVLLLTSSTRGIDLSVPALPGHSVLRLPGDRLDDLVTYLRTANVRRVHVHHVLWLDLDLRALLQRLDVGFDLTVHDYFAICPQVNLLPGPSHRYCGEPGPAICNACIAQRPAYGARDILSWRHTQGRLLREAERVLCPTEDVRTRLARYGLTRNTVLAPHAAVTAANWTVRPPPLPAGKPLRIAIIGALAAHKGEISVVTLAEAASPREMTLHLIGYAEHALPATVVARMSVTGRYEDADLPGLLAGAKPHVVWFPGQAPETYSYTLDAAIEAALPIVASRIGAFPERLHGRPLTWLVDPAATTAAWLAVFREVRAALGRGSSQGRTVIAARLPVADFHARDYAAPLRAPAVRRGELDLRQPGRLSVVVVPERLANAALSPCAYIRLLQPLDHPAIACGVTGQDRRAIDVTMAEAHEVSRLRADIVATQRYAIPNVATADALAARCREIGARLLYDIDDDLLNMPRDHPEAAMLRPRARTVARMLHHADAVWVSTPGLAAALRDVRRTVRVIPNGLDERLWGSPAAPLRSPYPVRLLFMGSATHRGDWEVVAPAMARVAAAFGAGMTFDMIGVLGPEAVPAWVNRLPPSRSGMASYPGYVDWITRQPAWDIGIAPLADTAFNRGKSAIKTFDYAALGLAVLASDVPVYRGSPADDGLVANTEAAWFAKLCDLIRDPARRAVLAESARGAFVAQHTLAAQADARRAAWLDLVPPRERASARA
jgi:GT2 family glycosyltransferase/glycosyltransferase involved in cell wall biosynthesis